MNANQIKHFLITLVFVLGISFVLDKVVFYSLNSISDQVYSGQAIGKLNHYLKIKDNLDFVIFGSSRANHNVDPEKIAPNSFNMGVDGKNIAYCAALIKLLPAKKEQTVLLHLDPEKVFGKAYDGKDISALSSKYNRNEVIQKEIDKLDQNNPIQKFYWSLSYNGLVLGVLKNYLKPNYDYRKYSGYDPIKVSSGQKEIFLNKLKKNSGKTCEEELKVHPLYLSYLDEVQQFCEDNNKKLILFSAPVYEDVCTDDNQRLAELAKEKKIPYLDLTNAFSTNNSIAYWKDETHLSDKGAALFTEQMKKALEQ